MFGMPRWLIFNGTAVSLLSIVLFLRQLAAPPKTVCLRCRCCTFCTTLSRFNNGSKLCYNCYTLLSFLSNVTWHVPLLCVCVCVCMCVFVCHAAVALLTLFSSALLHQYSGCNWLLVFLFMWLQWATLSANHRRHFCIPTIVWKKTNWKKGYNNCQFA